MTGPRTRGPYAGSAARKQTIIAAARRSFAERGFDNSTLRDIAERAGLTHAGLLHHYPDKNALLVAVLAEQDATDEETLRLEGLANSPRYLEMVVDVVREQQAVPETLRFWAETTAAAWRPESPVHDYVADRYRERRARIAAGLSGAPLSPEAASYLLPAVLDGLRLQWLLDPTIDILTPLREFLRLLDV